MVKLTSFSAITVACGALDSQRTCRRMPKRLEMLRTSMSVPGACGAWAVKASGRRLDLADRLQPLAGLHVEMRHGLQQRLQVGVLRAHEDVVERAGLDDLAVMGDDDFLGHVGDDAEIMRDQEHGHAELGLEVADQLQDLRLDRDIESGGRLVGDQQRRAADQRHGDHGALAEPARQLEGVGIR